MIEYDDIRKVYDGVPLDELVSNYNRRQKESSNQDEKQFSIFLEELHKELDRRTLLPFHKTMLSEISKNIYKGLMDEQLLKFYSLLYEVSKPKTTDHDILTSLEWQMSQTMNPTCNEYSYEKKYKLIFHMIFGKFDKNVQKQFLKLLRKYNYNSSLDLLELMTFILDYHNGEVSLEHLKRSLELLTTVKNIDCGRTSRIIADTEHGNIPFSFADECLDIPDSSNLAVGKCHFLVSDYLKNFPNLYGAYYYIPGYFDGVIDHSVMIDYDTKVVYDLSHNITLPLDYFGKYYNNLSFTISGEDFCKLSDKVKDEYGYKLYMHHLEEVKRYVKK